MQHISYKSVFLQRATKNVVCKGEKVNSLQKKCFLQRKSVDSINLASSLLIYSWKRADKFHDLFETMCFGWKCNQSVVVPFFFIRDTVMTTLCPGKSSVATRTNMVLNPIINLERQKTNNSKLFFFSLSRDDSYLAVNCCCCCCCCCC